MASGRKDRGYEDWCKGRTYQTPSERSRKKAPYNLKLKLKSSKPGKRVDDILKICPSCNRVFEEYSGKSKGGTSKCYEIYDMIPKIGKVEYECPECMPR